MNPIKRLLLQFPLYWIVFKCVHPASVSLPIYVCMCVQVSLYLCVTMYLVRQIMSVRHVFSDFNPKAPDWPARERRFIFINIMHIDSLICFHSQISLCVCLSLIHSMIGYLFPIILIQTACPWDSWSNRTALIYIHSPVVDNESAPRNVFFVFFLYSDSWHIWVN